MEHYCCGILTISDKGFRGLRRDTSGPALSRLLTGNGFEVKATGIVPDRAEAIIATLVQWTDDKGLDLILTTGGTGVSPSDVTPEATRAVIERELPGIAEVMRRESFEKTPHALLSRSIAGIRKQSLIINLPGSEKGACENLGVVLPALSHALYKIKGGEEDCGA